MAVQHKRHPRLLEFAVPAHVRLFPAASIAPRKIRRQRCPRSRGTSMVSVVQLCCGTGMARLSPRGSQMTAHHFCLCPVSPALIPSEGVFVHRLCELISASEGSDTRNWIGVKQTQYAGMSASPLS